MSVFTHLKNIYNCILINNFVNIANVYVGHVERTHSRSICKIRLKRLLQFLTGLCVFDAIAQALHTYRRTLARYSRDTWQIVDVIVGVDRISLNAGMKLMARERYGCAERRRNFAIALCDGNPSKHVSALPTYPRHHMPAVSSHLCP